MLLPLGRKVTPMEILNRLQRAFGFVASCDAVIEEFYIEETERDDAVKREAKCRNITKYNRSDKVSI